MIFKTQTLVRIPAAGLETSPYLGLIFMQWVGRGLQTRRNKLSGKSNLSIQWKLFPATFHSLETIRFQSCSPMENPST